MKITSKQQVTEVTLTITPDEARRIMADFDQSREPSAPGKVLYATLAAIVKVDDDAKQ